MDHLRQPSLPAAAAWKILRHQLRVVQILDGCQGVLMIGQPERNAPPVPFFIEHPAPVIPFVENAGVHDEAI